jgi:hypothetical protein
VLLRGVRSNLQCILSKDSRILQSIHPTFYSSVSSLNTFTESRISIIQQSFQVYDIDVETDTVQAQIQVLEQQLTTLSTHTDPVVQTLTLAQTTQDTMQL